MFIDLLRHGEPVGGARYRGHTDDPLSDAGRQQMASILREPLPWTHIITSPLQRCSDFATQLSNTYQLPLHIEPRFTEIDFGDWEGLTSEQLMAQDAKRLQQYWSDPEHNTPPNGETLNNFKNRVLSAWHDSVTHTTGKHLLIVTHGGVLRILLSHILSMPRRSLFKLDVPYACLTRFMQSRKATHLQLIFHNGRLS